jgi:hypothetical protein
VTERKISQFLEGGFGLLSSHDDGIPVYFRIVLTPELAGLAGGTSEDQDIAGGKMLM